MIGRIGAFLMRSAAALLAAAIALESGTAAADDIAAQRAAARQLIRGQLPSGLLDFDMDFFAGTGFGAGTTRRDKIAFIARQASGAYGLGKYFEQTGDQRVREPLLRLIKALGDLSQPVDKSTTQRAVEATGVLSLPFLRLTLRNRLDAWGLLYRPSGDGALVAQEDGYGTVWAGTTAMALLGELHYYRATGDNRFAAQRVRWLNGLSVLRIPNKGFREFPDGIDESSYANGEGWLAFAIFAQTFPSGPISAKSLRRLDSYMMATYAGAYDVAFFHWGALAAARRFEATADQRFADFIEKHMRTALDAATPADAPNNSCALVEGLAAGAWVMAHAGRAENDLYRALRMRIDAEMEKNLALQVPPDEDRLAAGPDGYLYAPRLRDYAGAFLIGRYTPSVRVDMTHHCISAIAEMQWE